MSLAGRIRKRLRAAAAKSRLEREMQEEMREHIAQAVERFRARGMSEADALIAARREFGNVGVIQEEGRDARGARWIESVIGDVRYATRQIARTPLLATTIVLTLTLAIGVGAAAFGTLSGVLTRPAPGVPADPALVAIRGLETSDGRLIEREFSYPELMEYARAHELADVAGFAAPQATVEMPGQSAGTAQAYFVTPNYFRTLGIHVSGPGFAQSRVDDHSSPELTAVIGRLYAAERFGIADSALGRTIRVNGINVQIVGVAPPRFIGSTGRGGPHAIWLPVSAWPIVDRQAANAFSDRARDDFHAIGHLADGASIREAMPAVELVASRSNSMRPKSGDPAQARSWSADVVRLRGDVQVKSSNTDDIVTVGMMTAVVILILLVCSTTVSSLLVGASVTRRHEIAVRLALGASRKRIIRQLLTESALLSSIAAVAGLAAFALISRSIRDSITDVNVDPSWTTALFTAGFAMLAAVLCGLSPALHATRDALSGVLKDSSTNATVRSRLQRVFVVAQIALTQPLLLGLAIAVVVVMRERGRTSVERIGEYTVMARFDTWTSANRDHDMLPAIMARIGSLPGVVKVLPVVSGRSQYRLELPAHGTAGVQPLKVSTQEVAPGYFSAMGITLLRGREFADRDTLETVLPIIIGSDLAARAFGDADPIGRRLPILAYQSDKHTGEVEVIGVVAVADIGPSEVGSDTRIFTSNGGPMSVPMKPDAILIRTHSLAEPLIATFRDVARAEAPLLPAREIKTLAQLDRDNRSEIIEATSASAVGGVLTLLLASIGLYAVVALGVSQRRREIGVRISLGARPGQVVGMFFRNGLRVSLIGLLIGLPLSAAAIQVIGSRVGIPPTNMPMIALVVAAAVVVVASLASWIPARRAAGVDPLMALRDG